MDAFKVLDDLGVEERAKELVGTVGRQAEALGEEVDRGELKFQEPVQDEPELFFSDGPGVCERGITAFNSHGTTSFSGVGKTGGLRPGRHETATSSGFFFWSFCRLAIERGRESTYARISLSRHRTARSETFNGTGKVPSRIFLYRVLRLSPVRRSTSGRVRRTS